MKVGGFLCQKEIQHSPRISWDPPKKRGLNEPVLSRCVFGGILKMTSLLRGKSDVLRVENKTSSNIEIIHFWKLTPPAIRGPTRFLRVNPSHPTTKTPQKQLRHIKGFVTHLQQMTRW